MAQLMYRQHRAVEVTGSTTLEQAGLYAGRQLNDHELVSAIGRIGSRFCRVFTSRTWFLVNQLHRSEVMSQRPLHDVTIQEAQDCIRENAKSSTSSIDARVSGVGFIPRAGGSAVVIVDFVPDTQQQLLESRNDIISALEAFDPDYNYDWRRFKSPGLPVGILPEDRPESRRGIAAVIRQELPEILQLDDCSFMPRIRG